MEREYKAFISYRHLPLEMAVAKKLHRRIERYVIPKPLRKNGEKRLGLVFRDQDELPISSDLSSDIRTALEHAEYLIVICSPETTKSEWVKREIDCFLQTHDRDHVLAVLADGVPDTAFPPRLTRETGADGSLIRKVEPLAANIAADTRAKRAALFRTESLRILAALIGCPFDALYRREQRYKRRRTLAAAAFVLALAAAFVGMLANRNALLRAQLRQTKENESRALAQLAASEYQKGNYHGAVEYALRALPSEENDRPYVAEAERQLGQILSPYRQGCPAFDQSFEQDTEIRELLLSPSGARAFTGDAFGCVRCFDTCSGALLWQRKIGAGEVSLTSVSGGGALLAYCVPDGGGLLLLDAATGAERRRFEGASLRAAAPEGDLFLCAETGEDGGRLVLRDTKDAQPPRSILLPDPLGMSVLSGAVSPDGRRAAVAIRSWSDFSGASLWLWDAEADVLTELDRFPFSALSAEVRLAFTESELLLAYDEWDAGGETRCYDPYGGALRWSAQTRSADSYYELINGKMLMSGSLSVLRRVDDGVLVGGVFALARLRADSGELVWRKTFNAPLLWLSGLDNGLTCVLLGDGSYSALSAGGYLGMQAGVKYFSSGIPLALGALAGDSFDETTAAMVSAEHPNRVSIVRRRVSDTATALPDGEALRADRLRSRRTSPSGELLAAAEYDYESKCVRGELWDLRRFERVRTFSVPCDSLSLDDMAITDDGVLIASGRALDTQAQTLRDLTGEEDPYGFVYSSLSANASGRVLTAILCGDAENGFRLQIWENGETRLAAEAVFPDAQTRADQPPELLALGADGGVLARFAAEPRTLYALYRPDAGTWLDLPELDAAACAMAETKPLLAVHRTGGGVALYDGVSGEPLREIDSPLPGVAVTKLLFADGDRLLLAFTASGTLAVFDAESGALLSRTDLGERFLSFKANARYDVFEDAAGDRLLVIYENTLYTESVCIVVDRGSWTCVGAYSGVIAYAQASDEVLLLPFGAGLYRMPLLNTEGLCRLAREFLARG